MKYDYICEIRLPIEDIFEHGEEGVEKIFREEGLTKYLEDKHWFTMDDIKDYDYLSSYPTRVEDGEIVFTVHLVFFLY